VDNPLTSLAVIECTYRQRNEFKTMYGYINLINGNKIALKKVYCAKGTGDIYALSKKELSIFCCLVLGKVNKRSLNKF